MVHKKGVPLNLQYFLIRARESGNWDEKKILKEQFLQLLRNKISSVSFNSVKTDIVRFVNNDKVLDIWSAKYFNDLIEQMKFKK